MKKKKITQVFERAIGTSSANLIKHPNQKDYCKKGK